MIWRQMLSEKNKKKLPRATKRGRVREFLNIYINPPLLKYILEDKD